MAHPIGKALIIYRLILSADKSSPGFSPSAKREDTPTELKPEGAYVVCQE